MKRSPWSGLLLPIFVLALAGAGCGGRGGYESYVPTNTDARQALETGLNAWKNGEPAGSRSLGQARLDFVDGKWQAGQKLAGFEVLEEEPADGAGPRWFKVRLRMKPSGQVTARYCVVGNDPIYVYREEDYKKLSM